MDNRANPANTTDLMSAPPAATDTKPRARRAPNDTNLFTQLPGTRLICKIFNHVDAPEWWSARYDAKAVCLRCRRITAH